jgi:dTDP-4-amino-4,6-dideoxygalactose transaminase
MKIPFVDLKAQYKTIEKEIHQAINEVLVNTSFIKGKHVESFERNYANIIGVKHCIGVGNGTDALIISLKTLGIGPGDEVIVPANSFIATSEAVTAVGAKNVFVDCDPKTYNICIDEIEAKITTQTKAIIAVHLYGQMADMESIMNIASKFCLKVIEDAAQAHLSEYKMKDGTWRNAGSLGDMATFSFFPGKNLGAYGDAGAIVTNDNNLARLARMYANHGRIAKYNHVIEGYNSRLDGLQAAILNVKLKYIKDWTEKRRLVAALYSQYLKVIPEITIPNVYKDIYNPVWHLYVIRTKKRDELKAYLMENGISTGIHYPIALPNLKAYKYLYSRLDEFPCASSFQEQILSLPVYPELDFKKIKFCCELISKFHKKNK